MNDTKLSVLLNWFWPNTDAGEPSPGFLYMWGQMEPWPGEAGAGQNAALCYQRKGSRWWEVACPSPGVLL